MLGFQNPLPDIAEATDAAGKMISLQADLFLLRQELKAIQHVRKMIWFGVSLASLAIMLLLVSYWIGMTLHEQGWSYLHLAFLSTLVYGGFALLTASTAKATSTQPRK